MRHQLSGFNTRVSGFDTPLPRKSAITSFLYLSPMGIIFLLISTVLPDRQFKRVHRSFIVSADAITQIDGNTVEISGKVIPIGDKYRKDVMTFFQGNNKFR